MEKKYIHAAFVCLFVVSFLGQASALMVEYDLKRLVNESDTVVVGQVAGQECKWQDASKKSIVTLVTLNVEQSVVGKDTKKLVVSIPGGQITNPDGSGIGCGQSDTPTFEKNEKVVLFLKPNDSGSMKIAGLFQGKFTVVDDPTTKEAKVRSMSKDLADPKTLKVKQIQSFEVPLSDFLAKVKEEASQPKTIGQ